MSRMGREFSLVLLGAGILTAGYFAAPSPDDELQKKADEQAAARVHGDSTGTTSHSHRTHGFMPLIWLHSPMYAGTTTGRPATTSGVVARGGFGGLGRSAGVAS